MTFEQITLLFYLLLVLLLILQWLIGRTKINNSIAHIILCYVISILLYVIANRAFHSNARTLGLAFTLLSYFWIWTALKETIENI